MVNKSNNKINKVDNINSKNISKIKKTFDKESFESFINSFGENKGDTINEISRVMSKNKLSPARIGDLSVNIKNIISYDERDKIDYKIQGAVSEIYLSKIWSKWKNNIGFKTIFESKFKNAEKNNFKGFNFKDISVKIDELKEKFPKIINKVIISNIEIYEKINEYGFSINHLNEFEKHKPSDRNIISELVFWETKEVVSKSLESAKNIKKDLERIADIKLNPYSVIEKDIRDIEQSKYHEELYDIKIEIDKDQDKLDSDLNNQEAKDSLYKKQKKLREGYLKKLSENSDKKDYVQVLKNLINNSFNFEELEKKDKETLINEITTKKLNEIKKNKAIKILQIDEENLKDFIKKLYDFSKTEDEIVFVDKDGNESKIFVKKYFQAGEHKYLNDIEEFKKLESLPIIFDIDLDKSDFDINQFPELFGKGVNGSGTTAEYQTKNGKVKISNNDTIDIEGSKLSYQEFHDLLTCEKDELKELLEKHGLGEKAKGDLEDFEDVLKNLNAKVISNKIKLAGNETNKLIQAYLLANTLGQDEKRLESEDQETVSDLEKNMQENSLGGVEEGNKLAEDAFQDIHEYVYGDQNQEEEIKDEIRENYRKLDDDGKKSFKNKLNELSQKENDPGIDKATNELIDYVQSESPESQQENQGNGVTEKQETPEEKFMNAWKGLDGNKFLEDKEKFGFRVGTRLFANIGGSRLPPKDVEDSFFEFEIIDIKDHNFKVKAIGGDLKGGIEGEIFTLPKTEEQLNNMQLNGSIYKVDKLKNKGRKGSIDNIVASNFFDKLSVFGDGEGQIKVENGKLVNNKGEEILGFGREEDEYSGDLKSDGKKPIGQTKVYTTYDIKGINKSKGTIKIACNFVDQNPEKLDQDVEYKYENELSFERFILLMEKKKVRGYTKKQHEERKAIAQMDKKDRSANKGKFRMFSLASIAGAFKGGFKKIQEAIKKHEEEQKENFENLLYSQEGLDLYSRMGSFFNVFGIFPGITDAFETSKMEYYADRENRTWKKIEKRYKLYESDPHFATLRGEQLQKLLKTPGYIGKHRQRHKMAAAFLILMKKDGPYGRGGFLEHYGKGFFVEKFLGPEHKKLFEQYRDERKRQLEEYKDINHVHWRKDIQAELNRMEFDYMVGVIDGRQPYGGKGDDEDYQASLRSREFANKLAENTDKCFKENESRSKEIGRISFRQAEQEYFRMLTAGRFHKALPFLEKMIHNAQNKSQENRAKMNFLGAMLTGIIKNSQDADVPTKFWAMARTMGLLPGIWCRDTDQADKLRILLDGITAKPPFEKFSEKVCRGGFNRNDFELGTFNPEQSGMKFLSTDWPQYRAKYGDKILDVIEFKDMESENSIINLASQGGENQSIYQSIIDLSREKTKEDIDQNLSYTYGYYVRSPWTANKGLVDKMIPKNGEYMGKETIEIESAEEFWSSVGRSINTGKSSNSGVVEFYLGKFFNWFNSSVWNQSNISIFARGLALVKDLKENGHNTEAKYNLWYLIKGMVHDSIGSFPSEFGIVIDKFTDFFWNNVDMVSENMMINTFGNESAVDFKNKYGMLSWGGFYNNYMQFQGFGGGRQKTDYQRKFKLYEENYINREIERMNKSLKRRGISGMPTPPSTSDIVVKHKEGYENLHIAA